MTTTVDLAPLHTRMLANFAAELHAAGPLQLDHLARMAEGNFSTILGERMRELVDDERARRTITAALMPAPPTADLPQAGPRTAVKPVGRATVVYPRAALGFQFWAEREARWEQAGKVGDPSDPAYDDFFWLPGGAA